MGRERERDVVDVNCQLEKNKRKKLHYFFLSLFSRRFFVLTRAVLDEKIRVSFFLVGLSLSMYLLE